MEFEEFFMGLFRNNSGLEKISLRKNNLEGDQI
jgi:hypothetical protein